MLSSRLKERRHSIGMKQAEVADALGVSVKAVSHWETGERLPDFYTIIRLAKVLDTSTAYLGGETEDPRPLQQIFDGKDQTDVPIDARPLDPEDLKSLEEVYLRIERKRQDKA